MAARFGNAVQQCTEHSAVACVGSREQKRGASALWDHKQKSATASVSQPLALSVFSGEASPYDAKAPILQQLIAIRQIVRGQQPESPAALALDCLLERQP